MPLKADPSLRHRLNQHRGLRRKLQAELDLALKHIQSRHRLLKKCHFLRRKHRAELKIALKLVHNPGLSQALLFQVRLCPLAGHHYKLSLRLQLPLLLNACQTQPLSMGPVVV